MFTLKSDSGTFSDRLNSVFDNIDKLESDRNQAPPSRDELRDDRKEFDIVEESIIRENTRYMYDKSPPPEEPQFKKPNPKPPRRHVNKTPDFIVNPDKWTKYSLEDVPDMDNAANTRAAFGFLDEMRKRKLDENAEDEGTTEDFKPVFKKPMKKKPMPLSEEGKEGQVPEKKAEEMGEASSSQTSEAAVASTSSRGSSPNKKQNRLKDIKLDGDEDMEVDEPVPVIKKRKPRSFRKSSPADAESEVEKTEEEMEVEKKAPEILESDEEEAEAADSNSSYVSTSSLSDEDTPTVKTKDKAHGPLKFVMPEYQIGQKGKEKKKESKKERAASDKVKLSYLDEFEDD